MLDSLHVVSPENDVINPSNLTFRRHNSCVDFTFLQEKVETNAHKLTRLNVIFDKAAIRGWIREDRLVFILPTGQSEKYGMLRNVLRNGNNKENNGRYNENQRELRTISRGPFLAMFANESSSFLNSLAVNEREEREKRQRRMRRDERGATRGILMDSIQRKRAHTAPSNLTGTIDGSQITSDTALQTSLTASQPLGSASSASPLSSTTSSGERNGHDDNVFSRKKNKNREQRHITQSLAKQRSHKQRRHSAKISHRNGERSYRSAHSERPEPFYHFTNRELESKESFLLSKVANVKINHKEFVEKRGRDLKFSYSSSSESELSEILITKNKSSVFEAVQLPEENVFPNKEKEKSPDICNFFHPFVSFFKRFFLKRHNVLGDTDIFTEVQRENLRQQSKNRTRKSKSKRSRSKKNRKDPIQCDMPFREKTFTVKKENGSHQSGKRSSEPRTWA